MNENVFLPSRQKHLFLSSIKPLSIAFTSNIYLYASRSDLTVALPTRTFIKMKLIYKLLEKNYGKKFIFDLIL